MTRQTSIDVYEQIKAEGLLEGWRWRVYQTLFRHGPLTSGEAHKAVGEGTKNDVATRISELKAMGCVREVGTRPCRVTGRNVLEVDVTDKVPQPIPKKATRQALEDLLLRTIEHCPEVLREEILAALPDQAKPPETLESTVSRETPPEGTMLFEIGAPVGDEGLDHMKPGGGKK